MSVVTSRSACRYAANYIAEAIMFDKTPEGKSFWSAIYYRLVAYGAGQEPQDKCFSITTGEREEYEKHIASLKATIEHLEAKNKELRTKLLCSDFSNIRNLKGL